MCLLYEWDWAAAEQAFKRALELNPGYVQGAAWYHLFYEGFASGRWDEALRGLREVQERDKLSGYAAGALGIGYAAAAGSMTSSTIKAISGSAADPVAMRETFGASVLEWAEKALALDPDAFLSVWARQLGYQLMNDGPRALEAANVSLTMSGRQALPLVTLGLWLAESGDVAGARSVFDEMRSRSVREYIPPTCLALLAAALRDPETAMAYSREAARRHDPQLVIFAISWIGTDHLRQLTEHQKILNEIRLPGWVARERDIRGA